MVGGYEWIISSYIYIYIWQGISKYAYECVAYSILLRYVTKRTPVLFSGSDNASTMKFPATARECGVEVWCVL